MAGQALGAVDEICGVQITNESEVMFLVNSRDNPPETWVSCKEIAGALTPRLLKGYMDRAQEILGVDSPRVHLPIMMLGIHGVKISSDKVASFLVSTRAFGLQSEKWMGPERSWPPELLDKYLEREKLVFNTMLALLKENNDDSGTVGEASATVAIAVAASPPDESSAQSDVCTLPNSEHDSLRTQNAGTSVTAIDILSGETAVDIFVENTIAIPIGVCVAVPELDRPKPAPKTIARKRALSIHPMRNELRVSVEKLVQSAEGETGPESPSKFIAKQANVETARSSNVKKRKSPGAKNTDDVLLKISEAEEPKRQRTSPAAKKPVASVDVDEDVYRVEKILGHRKKGRTTHYLIKWADYDDSQNTWEPALNVSPDLVLDYMGRI